MPSEIHAILFNKNKYNVKTARAFLRKHKYRPKFRVQESDKNLRYTLTDATKNGVYRVINFNKDDLPTPFFPMTPHFSPPKDRLISLSSCVPSDVL